MIQLKQYNVIGNELALVWSDGEESYINLETLRKACPCAKCQGEPDAMGRVLKPTVMYTSRSFQALSVQPLGGYALQLAWADGHKSGIFSFELLRELGARS